MQQNAVYILAWSIETEKPFTEHTIKLDNGSTVTRHYKNHSIRYWLEYANYLGKGSPMNVVQTKIGNEGKLDKSFVREKYLGVFKPEITFHSVESNEDSDFYNGYGNGRDGKLLDSLLSGVAYIKRDETIAEPLFKIREYLRKEQEKGREAIPYKEYLKKAKELKVHHPKEILENWLFKTGVVYYRSGKFDNKIILDQGWAIKAIYTIFDRNRGTPYEIENSKGIFSGSLLIQVWKGKYPDRKTHLLFVNFMKSCDLCFEIDIGKRTPILEERRFMAPQLITKERPIVIDDFWADKESIFFRYSDKFIHEGFIQSFIVKTAYLATLKIRFPPSRQTIMVAPWQDTFSRKSHS